MAIPEKRPCPCGYISPTTGKGCPSFVIDGITQAQVSEETADEIIEAYRDAQRLRFLLANPGVCSVMQFKPAHARRAWIDEQMKKPGKKKS